MYIHIFIKLFKSNPAKENTSSLKNKEKEMTEWDLTVLNLRSYPSTFIELALNFSKVVLILCHIYANIIFQIFFITF